MAARNGPKTGKIALGDQLIPVSRLHLHLSNPRHEPLKSETEAIAHLCNDELVTELAQDIAARGSLSPLEVMGVMPMEGHPGHYIALEGNRRTCALIVLSDPERAPKKYQAQLKRIAGKANVSREIKAHVFSNEGEAKQWIDLRHLGGQGGAGTKDWTPTQQIRAAGSNTKTSARANTLANLVLDRLTKRGLISKEQRNDVSLSTLTRYLGTPGVRAIVGLGSPNDLLYTHDPDEVDTALQRLTLDSIEPQRDGKFLVHSRSSSTDRLAYANKLKSRGIAPRSPTSKPEPPPKATKVQAEAAAGTAKRSANHVDTRRHLFDRSFTIAVKDPILTILRQEALDLPLADFRFSANYLLRAIVERIMVLFAKKTHCHQPKMSDEDLTTACWKQLQKLGAPRTVLTNIEQATHRAHSHSLHSLGHAVHGGSVPTASDSRARFITWEPVLSEMLKHL
jgi:hypothetical protein